MAFSYILIKFNVSREGYIRLSSEIYDIEKAENMDNQYIHLTNNAVQKNSISYEKFEPGNQMSFQSIQVIFKHIYYLR